MQLDLSCPHCAYCLLTAEAEDFVGKIGRLETCPNCQKTFEVRKNHLGKPLTAAQRQKAMALKAKAKAQIAAQSDAPPPQPKAPPKPASKPPVEKPQTKECPYCAETILAKAVKCKHCGEMLIQQADTEPEQPVQQESPEQGQGVSLTSVVFLALLVLWGIGKCSDSSKSDADRADDTLAYLTCEKAVESRLKSPSTADFAGYGNSQIRQSGKTFVIDSYVDAQNSFGAMVRTKWSCSASYKGGDPYNDNSWDINAFTHK